MATQSGPAHGAPAHAFPLAGVTDAPPRTTLALIAALGLTALLAPAAAADDDDLPIALGDVVAGSLDVTTEVDRYTFTAPAGQVVYLDRIDTDNPFGLNWSLQDAHGRALLGSTTQLPDLGPVTLMGGEYSVVISGEQHQVGTYEFAVRDATPDALVLPLDTEVGDEISQPGQIDRWTYTASPGEQVVLDFLTSSNANNLDWRLVDSRGRELLPPGSSIRDEGPFTLLGGEHVLEVRYEAGRVLRVRFEKDSFGALHQMLSAVGEAERVAAWQEIEESLGRFEAEDGTDQRGLATSRRTDEH